MRLKDSFTIELDTAIEREIKQGAADYIKDFAVQSVHFYHDDELIQANQCPAIGIIFRGSSRVADSMRGLNADGSVASGYANMDYRYQVLVWHKDNDTAKLNKKLKSWADGIMALLEDKFDLDEASVSVNVSGAGQPEELEIGGVHLAAMPLTVDLQIFRLQGATALPT